MCAATDERAPVRVVLAVGERDRERALSRELAPLAVVIAARCLDAPSLVGQPTADIDAVLAAADLHQFTAAVLTALRARGVPVVLLIAGAEDTRTYAGLARLVPAEASGPTIATALFEAAERGVAYDLGASDAGLPRRGAQPSDGEHGSSGAVVGVTSGKGAPGKTTLAIALAAALAAGSWDVVLVDADLRGGNVAPLLDLDPRRGLVGLRSDDGIHAERQPVLQELQEVSGFAVLAGVERPELAAALHPALVTEVVTLLRERFQYIVIDLGSYTSLSEPGVQDALLRICGEVVLITGADLVSLWNAQVALHALRARMGGTAPPLAAIVNRREGREHYDGGEVERALALPLLGVVREDRKGARRAIERQRALTAVGGPAARDVRRLAARLAAALPAGARSEQRQPGTGIVTSMPVME